MDRNLLCKKIKEKKRETNRRPGRVCQMFNKFKPKQENNFHVQIWYLSFTSFVIVLAPCTEYLYWIVFSDSTVGYKHFTFTCWLCHWPASLMSGMSVPLEAHLLLLHLLCASTCGINVYVREGLCMRAAELLWTRCPGRTASMLVWEPEACSHTSLLWLCWSYCLLRHHTSPGK